MIMMQINWKRVPYTDEKEEFERTAENFTEDRAQLKTNTKLLQTNYKTAKLGALSDSDWKKMKNTDSYYTKTVEDIQKAIKKNGEPRNITSVINEFTSGGVRAPIVIRLSDNTMYLVAGNTRLMIAKMLGITPKIVIINTDW